MNYVRLHTVTNRKGEAFTQTAMISENFGVTAARDGQCVNVLHCVLADAGTRKM